MKKHQPKMAARTSSSVRSLTRGDEVNEAARTCRSLRNAAQPARLSTQQKWLTPKTRPIARSEYVAGGAHSLRSQGGADGGGYGGGGSGGLLCWFPISSDSPGRQLSHTRLAGDVSLENWIGRPRSSLPAFSDSLCNSCPPRVPLLLLGPMRRLRRSLALLFPWLAALLLAPQLAAEPSPVFKSMRTSSSGCGNVTTRGLSQSRVTQTSVVANFLPK